MKKQRYTTEFKQEAVKMIIIDGVTVKEVSQQLGVPEGVLYSWGSKSSPLAPLSRMPKPPPCGITSTRLLTSISSAIPKIVTAFPT